VITVRGGLSCTPKPAKPTHGTVQLSATSVIGSSGASASFDVSKSPQGFYSEDFTVVGTPKARSLAPTIIDGITAAKLPPSVFTFASDLSSAHVNGAGPFLSGSLDFSGAAGGSPNASFGGVTGLLSARFDGLTGESVPEPGASFTSATLNRD